MQFIGGHDVNANLGVMKIMHRKVIGIHGLNNRNKKGRNLLGVLNANNLRVVNSFFKNQNYTMWRSFCDKKSPHMMDVITCSTSFFKYVNDCGAVPDGVRSDHSAVRIIFLNLSIKFKSNFIERPIIDWKSIQQIPELNDKFNLILHGKLRKANNYTEFNEAILASGEESAMILQSKCQGWYHHKRDTLSPVLDAQNEVLYHIRVHKPAPSRQTLDKLKKLQWEVDEVIAMAKTRWSRHLAEVIHNMNFRPKEAWANIRLLSKGERSHHSAPSTIQMRMPSGELATTDEENVRVFSAHFGKVLNDLKDTDNIVIDDIILREVSTELDSTPEWTDLIIAVVELTNDKSPGLNNVPPNAFRATTAENLLQLFDFIVEFWEDRLDFAEWHEGKVVPVPKSGDLFDPNKWRGVNLMDIGAKLFSSIMCKRLFCIIKKHGCTTQSGSSPGVVCPYLCALDLP